MKTTASMMAKPRGIPTLRPIPKDMTFGEFERIEDEPGVIDGVEKEVVGTFGGLR
jgi:hypothetical protein